MKTEDPTKISIDMYDDEFHERLEQNFYANNNANEASEEVRVNEKHETDSDATEIDGDDHSALSGELFIGIHFIF